MQLNQLPRPKAVLFDWDETLVDTFPTVHKAMNETFIAMQHQSQWTLQQTKDSIHHPAVVYFPEIFGDQHQAALETFTKAYQANHLQELQPMPWAENVLKTLQSHKIPIGIITNKRRFILEPELDLLKWRPFFVTEAIIAASEAGPNKPAADPVNKALAAMNISASPDVWVVGDKLNDAISGQNAGTSSVFLGAEHPEIPANFGQLPHAHAVDLDNFLSDLKIILVQN